MIYDTYMTSLKDFFEWSHPVVYVQLFTILVPSLHNIQNQLHYYNWLYLATCFDRYPAIIRPYDDRVTAETCSQV